MSAKDTFHDTVKEALSKQGWTITNDPLTLEIGGTSLYVDLGAKKFLKAEKNNKQIAVEIKSFIGKSNINDFHCAVGQFIHYRILLERSHPNCTLFLAIPHHAYNSYTAFFKHPLVKLSVKINKIKLLIYDTKKKEIIKWTN